MITTLTQQKNSSVRNTITSKSLLQNIKDYQKSLVDPTGNFFNGTMLCKVSGVTFDNRQKVLEHVSESTKIKLSREADNKHDSSAVKVMALINGEWGEVGYVPATMNKEIAEALDNGVFLSAHVWQKVGGGEYFYGLTIKILRKK